MFKRSNTIEAVDPAVWDVISHETARQEDHIELIASENYASPAVMQAQGSCLTNKYAEGYPGKRYYGGCEHVDVVEQLAIDRAKKLFCEPAGVEMAVNVQPHSGAQANSAVYFGLLEVGDTIMGLSLAEGGHLTHGMHLNYSGRYFKVVPYGLDANEAIDYDRVEQLARECKPKIIVAGASAYSLRIDFKRFAEIAHSVGAYLMVDMAHYAGLIAAGVYPTPFGHADIVTTTTHKTLRGPRGGLIFCRPDLEKKINSAVFPGMQGGPLMHVIAAKAVAFGEAAQPSFSEYAHAVVENAAALGEGLVEGGLRLVSGGTDNHLCLVDLTPAGITGKEAEELLEPLGITTNKNAIPNDPLPSSITSGVRVGSATITSRGFDADEARAIGGFIARAIFNRDDRTVLEGVAREVHDMLEAHPLYPEIA